jgi:hypothetical protein
MIGQTTSYYRILERLGGGSRAVVPKAEDTQLSRSLVLSPCPKNSPKTASSWNASTATAPSGPM